jgi:hypothetical protein
VARRMMLRWELGALLVRRAAWRINGRGKAPPITLARHVYACLSCYREIIKDEHIGIVPPTMIEDRCLRCRRMNHFGWLTSDVKTIR